MDRNVVEVFLFRAVLVVAAAAAQGLAPAQRALLEIAAGMVETTWQNAAINTTKDWADLEAMAEAGTLGVDSVAATLAQLLGADDDRITRLRGIAPA